MIYACEPVERNQGDGWVAEAIGTDGECYVVRFTGPDAEARAKEYAAWKNGASKDGAP